MAATPILKWVGGKSKLIPQFEPLFPKTFKEYYEVFSGGLAVYLHLFATLPTFSAHLTDLNKELITTYNTVRHHWNDVRDLLDVHSNECTKAYYLKVRKQELLNVRCSSESEKIANDIQVAARMIFLNKSCFNGMYRVNSKNQFNVPWGKKKRGLTLYNEDNILQFIEALKGQDLRTSPYEEAMQHPKTGDFVYIDPPYHPVSETSSFTSYTSVGFGYKDQEKLARTIRDLDARGCLIMASNSCTPIVKKLYKGFNITTIQAKRAINSNGDGRGPVGEYIIRNY